MIIIYIQWKQLANTLNQNAKMRFNLELKDFIKNSRIMANTKILIKNPLKAPKTINKFHNLKLKIKIYLINIPKTNSTKKYQQKRIKS